MEVKTVSTRPIAEVEIRLPSLPVAERGDYLESQSDWLSKTRSRLSNYDLILGSDQLPLYYGAGEPIGVEQGYGIVALVRVGEQWKPPETTPFNPALPTLPQGRLFGLSGTGVRVTEWLTAGVLLTSASTSHLPVAATTQWLRRVAEDDITRPVLTACQSWEFGTTVWPVAAGCERGPSQEAAEADRPHTVRVPQLSVRIAQKKDTEIPEWSRLEYRMGIAIDKFYGPEHADSQES